MSSLLIAPTAINSQDDPKQFLIEKPHQIKQDHRKSHIIKTIVLCVASILFTVVMNVLFFELGQSFLYYPQFINYSIFVFSWIFYAIWLLARNKVYQSKSYPTGSPKFQHHLHWYYFGLGFLNFLNGVMVQSADSHVSGSLQSFLSIFSVPLTGFVAHLWPGIKANFSRSKYIGTLIVLGGVLIGVIPTSIAEEKQSSAEGTKVPGWNSPLWISVFFVSLIPGAVSSVWSEKLLEHGMDSLHSLVWSNLYAIPLSFVWLPLQWLILSDKTIWQRQMLGFYCFLGDTSVPGCRPNAWIYLIAFVLLYSYVSYLLFLLIKHEGALFQSIVATVSNPLSAIVFSFVWLLGKDAETLSFYNIIAVFVIPIGVLVYKIDEIRAKPENEDDEPCSINYSDVDIDQSDRSVSVTTPISIFFPVIASPVPNIAESWPPKSTNFQNPNTRWF